MTHLERLAAHYLKLAAIGALKHGYTALTLYDEAELTLRISRKAYAQMAARCLGPERRIYQEMVIAAGMALVLLDGKRRRYIQRMGDKLFAAPQRVPKRRTG